MSKDYFGLFEHFDVEKFKIEFCKNDSQIEEVESILGCKLEEFYNHYLMNHYQNLQDIRDELNKSIFKQLLDSPYVNSMRSRVKNPYHLLDKIVRKVLTSKDYSNLSLSNYHYMFDDLLGFRLIMLYLDDWSSLDDMIIEKTKNDKKFLTDKKIRENIDNKDELVLISKIEINLRNGDNRDIYRIETKPLFKDIYEIKSGRYYRSVHYSYYYNGYCFEIQVRSAFDDAWGEIDHDILYPTHLNNKMYVDYSKLLNRIAGAANEMASYFKSIKDQHDYVDSNESTLNAVPDELKFEHGKYSDLNMNGSTPSANSISTPDDLLGDIFKSI